MLEISFNKISLKSREVIIPDLCIDESGWIVCVCFEFIEVLCIGSSVYLEVYHTMPNLSLCVWISIISEKLRLCIIYVLLFFKIYIGIDTWEDEVLMIDNRKWDISDKNCSDKFACFILFSIEVNVFKKFDDIFGFKCLGIDREDRCFGIGYTSLDIVTSISLDVA